MRYLVGAVNSNKRQSAAAGGVEFNKPKYSAIKEMPEPDVSFINYGNGTKGPVFFVGDGRSRVRRVMRTTTRHVTVVSYNSANNTSKASSKKESRTHTSHHITTVR